MSQPIYIEDIFLAFYESILLNNISIQYQDRSAASSFYTTIDKGNALTRNQANYVLRILEKYKNTMLPLGLDYREDLKNPKWKQPFRIIDLSKKIFVEKTEEGEIYICLKFPYHLLQEFDNEIFYADSDPIQSVWDESRKLRKIKFYDANIIHIYEFCKHRGFEIDESFLNALSEVEEIWQNQEKILPGSVYDSKGVSLINASNETKEWFDENKTENIINDLLLAKTMGYPYIKNPKTPLEIIAASQKNHFYWNKDHNGLFEIIDQLDYHIAVLVTNDNPEYSWIKNFINGMIDYGIDPESIKMCYRKNKHDDFGFNEWIRENNLGGRVQEGKIFIFNNKPPKWLFNNEISVKLIITDALYPPMNRLTNHWLNGHPLVIYAGEARPSAHRGIDIG